MGESEYGKCDICLCEKNLSRMYYYYNIDCNCCSGNTHFEIVRHCADCTPKRPMVVTVNVKESVIVERNGGTKCLDGKEK